MSELARLTDPEMFAVVAQTVAFRYYGKLKSESEDALARAVALANKVASIRAVYGTAEIFPALVSCAIAKLSASTQSFPTSSRHSRQAGVAGTESSIDAEHFGATCSRDDLLDVLGLVFEAMTAGASELTNENTRALATEIENAIGTEQENDASAAALFANISALLSRARTEQGGAVR